MKTKIIVVIYLLFCGFKLVFGQYDTLKVASVGDIMFHEAQYQTAQIGNTGKYNFEPSFRHVKPIFKKYDLVIGNLETTLSPTPPFSGYPQFASPDTIAYFLKEANFNFIVTANNHCLDRGPKGLIYTKRALERNHLATTGTFYNQEDRDKNYPFIWQKGNFTIAILNCTYGTNGMPITPPVKTNLIDTVQMLEDLEKAKLSKPDAIILAIHWGEEYQLFPNAFQKKIANFAFRNGVDIILGSHPHVLQPLEKQEVVYQGKKKTCYVIYSLGNFISNMRGETPRWRYTEGGIIFTFEILKHKESGTISFQKLRYIPVWVWQENQGLAGANFQVLPCAKYEFDSKNLRLTDYDKRHIKQFLSDTRKHLDNRKLDFIEQNLDEY
ncbi:MAG: CapA family protein [Bacteroidia bacterium]|nr:CapA family protein [Bacteroidia bacterium]